MALEAARSASPRHRSSFPGDARKNKQVWGSGAVRTLQNHLLQLILCCLKWMREDINTKSPVG